MTQGLIVLDKKIGLSSNQALQRIRRLFKAQLNLSLKMGHTGTLDPLATGMLPIFVGRATQLCHYFSDQAKIYEAVIQLGESRSTGDQEGECLEKKSVPILPDFENLLLFLKKFFLGPQWQIPPMFSALKKDGKALYTLARKGVEIERAPRKIEIFDINLLEFGKDYLKIKVHVSKGTYIRVLGEDIAKKLGTLGYLSALRRISVNGFAESLMQSEAVISEDPNAALLSLNSVIPWPVIALSSDEFNALRQGKYPAVLDYLLENLPDGMIFIYQDVKNIRDIKDIKDIKDEIKTPSAFGRVENKRLVMRKFFI